jgi:hypothetical protein
VGVQVLQQQLGIARSLLTQMLTASGVPWPRKAGATWRRPPPAQEAGA